MSSAKPRSPWFYWAGGFSVIILYGHTNITLLIANDVDIATISSRAGHAKVATTLNTYSHAIKNRDTAAANKLDDMVASKLKPNPKRIEDI